MSSSKQNKLVHTLNLGDLSNNQSLLIFGGCYSNLEATRALQQWADQNGYGSDQCICTGDIVAYCAEPLETIKLIRDWGVTCIQGNVEQSLANNIDECGCGFESGTTCDILSKGWFPYADALVQSDDRQWFSQLPEHVSFSFAGKQCLLVHGAVSDVSKFMFASHPKERFANEFSQAENADVIIAGHSGLPFTSLFSWPFNSKDQKKNSQTKQSGIKVWHSSGASGMPANDGTQSVWFSTISIVEEHITETAVQDSIKLQRLEFQHHRLDYDAEKSHNNMKSKDLTQGYHQALLDGQWPSMDVLPDHEKQQASQVIQLETVLF